MVEDRLQMDENTVIDFVNWLVEPSTSVDRPLLRSEKSHALNTSNPAQYTHKLSKTAKLFSRTCSTIH